MQTKTDLSELLRTVEQIRSELHPDLDSEFLRAVVAAEEQNPDDEGAIRAIELALKGVLAARGAG